MSWREQTAADLRVQEGLRLAAYQDGLRGVWTLGYGHTAGVKAGDTCDQGQADKWLEQDMKFAQFDLDTLCPWWASAPDAVRRGLLNMCFNLGRARFSRFYRLIAAGEAGYWAGMAKQVANSLWATQLPTRAQFVADLFRSAEAAGLAGAA